VRRDGAVTALPSGCHLGLRGIKASTSHVNDFVNDVLTDRFANVTTIPLI
jgi:hypothetical protein